MNIFIEQLKRAFALWWRVKLLWPLGMLAALVGYGDSAVSGNFNVSQRFPSDPDATLPPWVEDMAQNELLREIIANPLPYVVAAVALVIGLALVCGAVGALAHGALIRVADVADQGYTPSLGDGLRVGAGRMAAIFVLNVILALPVIVVVAVIAGSIAVTIAGAVGSLGRGDGPPDPGPLIASLIGLVFCIIALALLMAVVGALLGVWSRVAQRACVIEARGPLASLGRAWGLIRRNLGLTVITWFFQAILGGIVGLLLTIPAAAVAIPMMFTTLRTGSIPIGLVVGLFIYALLANTIVGGLLTAFNSALWTLVFRAFLTREQPQAFASYEPG